ncbi:MAG: hypothetical protein AAF266_11660 [Planctomycetota bacterium]
MIARWLVALLFATGIAAEAAPLIGNLELVEEDLVTFDPIVSPAPIIDVWHVSLTNPNLFAVDDVTMRLEGPLIDFLRPDFLYAETTDLPTLGPNPVAESFFVLPAGDPPVEPDVRDDWAGSNFIALPRGEVMRRRTPFMEPGETITIAVLSIPTGSTLDLSGFSGEAFFDNGTSAPIRFVPEPSTACLTVLLVAGLSDQRLLGALPS